MPRNEDRKTIRRRVAAELFLARRSPSSESTEYSPASASNPRGATLVLECCGLASASRRWAALTSRPSAARPPKPLGGQLLPYSYGTGGRYGSSHAFGLFSLTPSPFTSAAKNSIPALASVFFYGCNRADSRIGLPILQSDDGIQGNYSLVCKLLLRPTQ